jgi:hypothetical protein
MARSNAPAPAAPNFLKDNPDLLFYLEHGVDWAPVVEAVERGRFGGADGFADVGEAVAFYREAAETFGEFVAREVAPHSAAIDREGVTFVDGEVKLGPTAEKIFKKIKALDIHGLVVPRELGGTNAPMMLYFLNSEMLARADVSLMTHHGFHGGMAAALLFFSVTEGTTRFSTGTDGLALDDTRFRKEIEEIVAGKAWASMDLTEPDAGSDLARVRTRAEQDEDGNWFVTGQKIFITSGHARYHVVLARSETVPAGAAEGDAFAGLAGLSLYLVEAFTPGKGSLPKTWHASFDRIEEKLGHHGSPTVAITYERSPAQLVGERGDGFKLMLLLMNNARIGVSFEALGLMESARRMAQAYAADRPSMGKTIDRHELIADMLDEMESDTEGLRALAVYAAWHEELGQRAQVEATALRAQGDEVGAKRAEAKSRALKAKARRVTPLGKYFGAERAVEHARRCVQIHGGVGYTKEYGAEKLLRDAMVLPIYEGTSQIQSLMAMKDTLMGIMKDPGAFVKRQAKWRWQVVSSRDALERRVARLKVQCLAAQQHLMQRTATDKLKAAVGNAPVTAWAQRFMRDWDPKRDFAYAMLHAERLMKLLVDEAIAGILLKQVKAHPDRRPVLERWLERAEPRGRFLYDEITTTGDRLLAKLHEAEAAMAKAEG